jgi:metallophosphoesterase superfamily enzyme
MTPTYDDRALLLGETLVVADLHVGRGTGGNLEFPVGSGTELVERFRSMLDRHTPETVVVAGDLLHSLVHIDDLFIPYLLSGIGYQEHVLGSINGGIEKRE